MSGRAAWFGNANVSSGHYSTYVWATADGAHWRKYPFRCTGARAHGYGLSTIAAASPSHVVFLCLGSGAAGSMAKEVLSSVNGGRTVHLAGPAPLRGVGGVIAVPPHRANVITLATASADNFLDRSANGGKSWTGVTYPTGGGPWSSLSYVSRTVGWIVLLQPGRGSLNQLLRTTDAGLTWHPVRFGATPAAR